MYEPSKSTVKKLFALSGNRCAFRPCDQVIVDQDGVLVGEICHINAARPGGARFDPTQKASVRHAFENLILLCRNHHKMVDANPKGFRAESLRQMKAIHESMMARAEKSADAIFAELLISDYRRTTITNNVGNVAVNTSGPVTQTINIRASRRLPGISPPDGTVGADRNARRYAEYLIKRYNQFAERDKTRKTQFRYGVLTRNIERKFGTRWQLLPIERATELFLHLQAQIDGTLIGRVSKSSGQPTSSSFEAYLLKHGG